MLESASVKITTALLASKVGVSEAALYRHFPSVTKMFRLIVFAEDAIWSQGKNLQGDASSESKCRNILTGILVFSEKNPGFRYCREKLWLEKMNAFVVEPVSFSIE